MSWRRSTIPSTETCGWIPTTPWRRTQAVISSSSAPRLGLAEKPDLRSSAHSTYVFESTRERFGIVRGREPILPFDIVVQGDLSRLGIAAFPRWRVPRETPDAFLYR